MRDFSAATLRRLALKGITVLRPVALPTGRFADYERGYSVNDNGCGRIWTFEEVLEAAGQ
jgi:hypothetical protein